MKKIEAEEDASRAKYEIEIYLLRAGDWVLYHAGRVLARSPLAEIETTVSRGRLILAWWDDDRSESVRVTGWKHDSGKIALRVTRGLGGETTTLTLGHGGITDEAAGDRAPAALPERRRWYAQRLAGAFREQVPGITIRRITTGADRQHGVPGRYARLVLSRCGETILVLGAGEVESTATIDGMLTAGLIWLGEYNLRRRPGQRAGRLRLCLPPGRLLTTIERMALLDTAHYGGSLECYGFDEASCALTPIRPFTQTELLSAHPREIVWPLSPPELARLGGDWMRRIVALAPEVIEVAHRAGRDEISYSIHGIEFARQSLGDGRGEIRFGIAGEGDRTILDEIRFLKLSRLVGELIRRRHARADDHRHAWFRLRTEGWLESLLRRDIHALDPALDQRFVYSQVPAWQAEERSVIDLLSLRRESDGSGRLVVIEVKAAEDIQLPLQGLDYWLRVEQARARGEFAHRGLFAGARISARSPLLYLVAPRLRFHRSFTTVADCLHPEVEAWRFGINADWRGGVRVHEIERLGAGASRPTPSRLPGRDEER